MKSVFKDAVDRKNIQAVCISLPCPEVAGRASVDTLSKSAVCIFFAPDENFNRHP